MRIEVLLFGPQAALAKAERVCVDLAPDQPTAAAVMIALEQAVPALAPGLAQSRLAINHAYASPTQVVEARDEVALIGMVSGG